MADYLVTGKKGAGKSLFCIGLIRDALLEGKRVATNLDVNLEKLFRSDSRLSIVRIPDRPTADDLHALGRGQTGVVEDDNGLIVIDECGTFLNSRAWGDKSRQPLLDWLVHSRKHGWDVYFIAQGIEQLDKQVRSTLIEYRVAVTRTDKWPIPGITPLVKLVSGYHLTLPKMHIGTIRHGMERDAIVIDRKFYRGSEIYPAYQTQQVFLDREHPDAVGAYSVLSAWHVVGRYQKPLPPWFLRLWALVFGEPVKRYVVPKPKHRLVLLIEKLPVADRVRHFQRLERLGAFGGMPCGA